MATKDVSLPEGTTVFVSHGKYEGHSRFILALTQKDKPGIRYFDGPKGQSREQLTQDILATLEEEKKREENNVPPDFSDFIRNLGNENVISLIDQIVAFKPDVDPKLMLAAMEQKRKIQVVNSSTDQRKIPRVWYHDPVSGERSRIMKSEESEYIAKGWKPGRDLDKAPDLRWYNRPVKDHPGFVERERISFSQIPEYVMNGYFAGKGSGKTWDPNTKSESNTEEPAENKQEEDKQDTEEPVGDVAPPEGDATSEPESEAPVEETPVEA